MNAVEIESAVSDLARLPFDPAEFPFAFLAAFDRKETTLKRLRKGDSNKSDLPRGVPLSGNITLRASFWLIEIAAEIVAVVWGLVFLPGRNRRLTEREPAAGSSCCRLFPVICGNLPVEGGLRALGSSTVSISFKRLG